MAAVLGAVDEQGVPTIDDRLVGPEEWSDPYSIYRRVREQAPVVSLPAWDEYIFLRWADAERILRDPLFSSSGEHRRLAPPEGAFALNLPVLLFMDPPDHTRLRGLVSRAFTPRTIEQLRAHVADLVQQMLDEVDPSGFDLIESLAYPLPVTVICELLGVPVADRHLFGPWSSDLSRLLDGDIDDATLAKGMEAALYLLNYLNLLFDERREEPQDDLVSALLAVEEEGDRLTEEELRAIVMLLFVAGHETTMNLIGNGTVALLRERSQWDLLCADPGLAPGAVEEVLRFDGPVHITQRVATRPAEVAGVKIEEGQTVIPLLAAVNRDPARFADPDTLDIRRPDVQHLTFSHGIHYCLGAALARLEGQEVFKALPQRFPKLDLAAEPVHRDHFVLRGYQAVHLTAG